MREMLDLCVNSAIQEAMEEFKKYLLSVIGKVFSADERGLFCKAVGK